MLHANLQVFSTSPLKTNTMETSFKTRKRKCEHSSCRAMYCKTISNPLPRMREATFRRLRSATLRIWQFRPYAFEQQRCPLESEGRADKGYRPMLSPETFGVGRTSTHIQKTSRASWRHVKDDTECSFSNDSSKSPGHNVPSTRKGWRSKRCSFRWRTSQNGGCSRMRHNLGTAPS